MKVTDLVAALAPTAKIHNIGIRPGEKLHEEMISTDEARRAVDRHDHYVVLPDIVWANQSAPGGKRVTDGFRYSSDSNTEWLDQAALAKLLDG